MSSDSQNYDVGGTFGGGYDSTTGACAEKCVCDALDAGLTAISDSLDQINTTLYDLLNQSCTVVDDCAAEIIALIDSYFRSATKSCDECKADLEAGLGGTIEYAVACAGACINEVKSECNSLQDDGSSCTTCGCKPCVCTGLECVSIDPTACEPEKKPKQFIGWCDPDTQDVIVSKADQGSPGPTYTQRAIGDDEQVVFEEAARTCGVYKFGVPVPDLPPSPEASSKICRIEAYDVAELDAFKSFDNAANVAFSGGADIVQRVGALGFEGLNLRAVTDILRGAVQVATQMPVSVADEWAPQIAKMLSCGSDVFIACARAYGTVGTVEKITGIDFSEWTWQLKYAMNASCRQKQLDPKLALDAYLSNAFDHTTLDTHFAIAGLCEPAVDWAILAGKSKPEPEQLVMMRHRGIIDNAEYATWFRRLGYLDQQIPENIYTISEHLPDIATVNRMNQAGVTDDQAVTTLGLDAESGPLMEGQLHDWLRGNGISDETIKQFWRAHWLTPGIANLFEFWHRLRDDDTLNGNGELESAIDQAYAANGIPPFWRKYFDAVKLVPLLKRDIRVAYTSGALADDDLERIIKLTGHDDESVSILVKELKPARRHAILAHTALRQWVQQIITASSCIEQLRADGYDESTVSTAMRDMEWEFERSTWAEAYAKGLLPRDNFVSLLTAQGVTDSGSIALANKLSFKIVDHQSIRDYIAGTVSRTDAASFMLNSGVAQTTVTQLLADADYAISDSLAIECVRGVKHRYLLGEISNDEARTFLQGRNLDASRVDQLVSNFDCEKSATGTKVAVEKLCHWLYLGTISQADFADRLIRLGYSEENASLLLYDCVQANTMRDIKEAKRISQELQSAADKKQRADDKLSASRQRSADRLARARSDKARLRANRDRQLLSAGEKVYKATGATLTQAVETVKEGVTLCSTRYGLAVDDCLRIVLLASEEMKGHDIADFQVVVTQLAEAAASDALEPSDADIGLPPSSNGATQPSG